jgi:hypothetical protein
MGAIAQLADATVAVEPGKSATTSVTVRNNGSVVDRFTFEALGPAAEWVTFSPDTLSLFPEASGTVSMTVSPPRTSAVPAGTLPFGVKVLPAEDPEGATAEEGTLNVAAFSDVGIELLPRVVHGRRAGLARLAVDNRSNIPYDGELVGTDPAAGLRMQFRPAVVSVPPGGAEFVRLRIQPAKTFWRGHPVNKPFQLSLTSTTAPHPPRLQADGTLLQEALLPKWLLWLIGGLVALAALLAILWFTLFKPQVKSTATDAARQQLAAAGIPTNSSTGAAPTGGSGGGGAGGSTSPTTQATTSQEIGTSGAATNKLTVNGSGTGNGNGSRVIFTVPAGRTLQVTDMLIQNAAGDNGILSIARNGTVLMQWAMADFRDLDYHWVSPTLFGPGAKMVMTVNGCSNACHPGVYYAGQLVSG